MTGASDGLCLEFLSLMNVEEGGIHCCVCIKP